LALAEEAVVLAYRRAMMKICPRCGGTFAGGSFCPGCGVRQPLIDMSSEEAKPYLAASDMQRAVLSHYAERSGMVRSALGFLIGILGGIFILRFAIGAESAIGRLVFAGAAAAWGAFFAGGSVLLARHMARRGNEGVSSYVCVDENLPVEKFRPPPRRGLGWLTW
jgi:small-conductance mechanosensitive channel